MITQTQSKPYLLYLIILLLSVIIIGGWFKWNNSDIRELEKQLIKSEKRVDSLSMVNSGLNSEITLISAQIRGINNQLNRNKNELNNLKEEHRLKQQEINLYNYYELVRFYENRYNQKLPQE